MYDPGVTAAQIEKVARAHGWKPEYHTLSQVETANSHFADLWDAERHDWTRKLQTDEQTWIRNEQRLSQLDFGYWSQRYAFIQDWRDRPVRFVPNIAQQIKLDIWAECERRGQAVSEMNLKARQLGVSTLVELAVSHRVQFWPYTRAIVASSDPDKSELMVKMLEFAMQMQPAFLVPPITGYAKGERIEFGRQNCTLSIQHGSQLTGIARGFTPTVAHLSEVADFEKPGDLIDASLLRCMHPSPWMFLVLESTGKGRHNWWHNRWEASKSLWTEGKSRFQPIFLPWYVGTDIYPTKADLVARPVPKDWKPEDLTLKHAERAADYVSKNDLLRKYLGDDWRMPIEQMWFWEITRLEYKKNNELSKFYSELCADDTESFQQNVISVFDADLISAYREASKPPIGAFKLKGPASMIHPRHWPQASEIDHSLPTIPIDEDFTLYPVRFRDISTEDPTGKVLIFEWPEDEEDYGLGLDCAGGVGLDNSAIQMLRKGNMQRNDTQVCEFVSPHLNASEMVPYCHAIGKMYSRKVHGTKRQCKMVIEIQAGGNLAQLELRKMGWTRFHHWLRAYDSKVLSRARSNTLGWATNQWSRNQLIVTLMTYLRSGWLNINSPWFVDEMADLEADETSQKIKAQHGAHDDRIMALGMVLFSLHDLEIRANQPTVSRIRVDGAIPEYAKYDPGWQGREAPNSESPVYQQSTHGKIVESAY